MLRRRADRTRRHDLETRGDGGNPRRSDQFDAADTLVSGRTNCNRFFGKYEKQDGKLEFGNLGMTRMACPDMQYEDAFVRMLDEVDRYEIVGSELKLYDDKTLLAGFRAAAPEASAEAERK